MKKKKSNDLHTEITNKIIELLEQGVKPWEKAWSGGDSSIPANPCTKKAYSGINVIILWSEAFKKNYSTNYWATYKQITSLGGKVKKGEKGTKVIFYKTLVVDDENNDDDEKSIPLLRAFTVFNLDQTEGIEIPKGEVYDHCDIKKVESFIKKIGAIVKHEGNRAFYAPLTDKITLPEKKHFKTIESYYATSLHEHTHWTGHETRLNRDFKNRFGTESYAFEELIAELGAAFISSELCINSDIENHASYIVNWLRILKNDNKAIFKAASEATKACTFLKNKKK